MNRYILWRYPLDQKQKPYSLPTDRFDTFERATVEAVVYARSLGVSEYEQASGGLWVATATRRVLARIEIDKKEHEFEGL
jgi:hypothetical protein